MPWATVKASAAARRGSVTPFCQQEPVTIAGGGTKVTTSFRGRDPTDCRCRARDTIVVKETFYQRTVSVMRHHVLPDHMAPSNRKKAIVRRSGRVERGEDALATTYQWNVHACR